MTAPTLYEMAEVLMDLAKQAITGAGLTVPERRVIYIGEIPADCEQLAVIFDGWSPTPAQEGMVVCQTYRWAGAFTVLITRGCVPGISNAKTLPKAVDMSATAKTSSDDSEALLDLVAMVGEHDGATVAVNITAPQGGLQSVALEISVPVTKGIGLWPMPM